MRCELSGFYNESLWVYFKYSLLLKKEGTRFGCFMCYDI